MKRMLTEREIDLVQTDWSRILPIAEAASTLFYDRLFFLHPRLRALFKPNLREQRMKLVKSLSLVIAGLDDLPSIVARLESLGRRHVRYGAREEHYAAVGSALIWMLEQGLEDAFDAEHREAWRKVYDVLAGAMISAARQEAQATVA